MEGRMVTLAPISEGVNGDGQQSGGTALVVDGISVSLSSKMLLEKVNCRIELAGVVSVIGPSGCGKSTLMKAIAGVLPLRSGRILLDGCSIREVMDVRPASVAYLSQAVDFHPVLTVRAVLEYACRFRGEGVSSFQCSVFREEGGDEVSPDLSGLAVSRAEFCLRQGGQTGGGKTGGKDGAVSATEAARMAGIEGVLDQRVSTLSGGQLRRLALAELLPGNPEVLLLDELTSGLDVHSDAVMMEWLRDLAHTHGKIILLVTHHTAHLDACDQVLFMHAGRLVYDGLPSELPRAFGVETVEEVFGKVAEEFASVQCSVLRNENEEVPLRGDGGEIGGQGPGHPTGRRRRKSALLTANRSPLTHYLFLCKRQWTLYRREPGQWVLHLVLAVTFPLLVAVFALRGLPQVRSLSLMLGTDPLASMQEQLEYLREAMDVAALVSGLAMFQVVLLSLSGANNGAREIARERGILDKERRAGLSAAGYAAMKLTFVTLLCAGQALVMAWFVKEVCGFPGAFAAQFGILFATTLAVGTTCLAISAWSRSPEKASLLAVYLVGFQLPLSGAALALPEWLAAVCRPLIAAYWGWSGFLRTLTGTRHFDVVRNGTSTAIASYDMSMGILAAHVVLAAGMVWWGVRK